MLHTGFPIRAAAAPGPGEYDTHSEESGPLSPGAPTDCPGPRAFQHDLEQRNLGQK